MAMNRFIHDKISSGDVEEYLATHCYDCGKYIAYGDYFFSDYLPWDPHLDIILCSDCASLNK